MPNPLTKQRSPWKELEPTTDSTVEMMREYGSDEIAMFVRLVHDGTLTAIRSRDAGKWHMSISWNAARNHHRAQRYPTWDEITHARYELLPDDLDFVMHLPPLDQYVSLHPTTFHLHQHDGQ